MEAAPPIYEFLVHTDNLAADAALLESLPDASDPYQRWIIEALLARGTDEGLNGLVRWFHALSAAGQRLLIARVDRLFSALRVGVRSGELQTRLNAVEIIKQSGNQRLAYLLELALRDGAPRVRAEAAQALRTLAERLLASEQAFHADAIGTGSADPAERDARHRELLRLAEDRRLLTATLKEAAYSFETHLRTEVIEAVMWFAEVLDAAFWEHTATMLSRCAQLMEETFRRSSDPRLVGFAYEALRRARFRPAIARTLATRQDQAFMLELVRQSWAVADPAVRKGLAWIKQSAWLEQSRDRLHELPEEVLVRLPRFVAALGLPADGKLAYLRRLLSLSNRSVQRAALWALLELDAQGATQLLRTVAGWEDPELSRIAACELKRRDPSWQEQDGGVQSHEPVDLADGADPDQQIRRFWEAFDGMDADARQAAGRQVARLPQLAPYLVRKMRTGEPSERVRAIRIAQDAGLLNELQEEVYRLGYDPDRFVRATAVAALVHLPGPTARRILRAALLDEDPRVQANAIEAMAQLRDTSQLQQLVPKLSDHHQRVRANTVRALLSMGVRQAAEALLAMLTSPDRAHRISALWVVERLKLRTLIYRVVQMAGTDPDPQVRRRASRVLGTVESGRKIDAASSLAAESLT